MNPIPHRGQVILGVVATLLLAGLSVLAIAALTGRLGTGGAGFLSGSQCAAPNLAGTVVTLTVANMGGPMMGQGNGTVYGGGMRMSADRATVPSGRVSFLVTNGGSINHEMIILPLPDNQIAATRPVGGDGKVDEKGSLGEASATCGEGAGQGIAPGASGWVTITLAPGRYELLCNLPGHYAAGMYTQLTAT